MAARLARGPVTHEVWIQVAGEGHDPHSATSVWKGCRELLAGRIVVTAELPDPEGGPASPRRPSSTRPGSSTGSSSPTTRSCATGAGAYTESVARRTTPVKTLVIGTGGREHALARALSRDPGVTEVHAAPGNPGIAEVATLHDVDPLDGDAVAALAAWLGVDLVVVGPEAPLVAGVADAVRDARDRGVRAVRRGRPAGGLQGVRQGGHGGGRRPHRPRVRVHDTPRRRLQRSTSSARRTS